MANARVLQCGVIGAGIAGLGAPIALSNAGHEVEIFERSQFKQETGAAITICPNASKILDHWGFDQIKTQPTDMKQSRVYDWQTLELESQEVFGEIATKYSHRFASYHRVDLHNGMRALVDGRDSVKIRLGMAVTRLDYEAGKLTFADGVCIQKDLVVVADGINVSSHS